MRLRLEMDQDPSLTIGKYLHFASLWSLSDIFLGSLLLPPLLLLEKPMKSKMESQIVPLLVK